MHWQALCSTTTLHYSVRPSSTLLRARLNSSYYLASRLVLGHTLTIGSYPAAVPAKKTLGPSLLPGALHVSARAVNHGDEELAPVVGWACGGSNNVLYLNYLDST